MTRAHNTIMSPENVANVLGALALALEDDIRRATAETGADPAEAAATS